MNTIEIKSDLVEIINKINDFELLKELHSILIKKTSISIDYWDDVPVDVQQEIDSAIKEADRGELIPHEQVMQEIRNKYKV
jgi:predicted transcriptional regulator